MFLTKSQLSKSKIHTATILEIRDEDGNPGQIRFRSLSARQAEELQSVDVTNSDSLKTISKRIAESLVDEHGSNFLTQDDVMEWPVENQTAVLKAMAASFQGIESQGEGSGVAISSATPTN